MYTAQSIHPSIHPSKDGCVSMLTHWGWHKMAAILQKMKFWKSISLMWIVYFLILWSVKQKGRPAYLFSFFADLTVAYLAPPAFYFFRGRLAVRTKFKSDRPTETINPVNVDYFTCHLWSLCHLFPVYMVVIIHILHDENQSLLKIRFCKIDPKIICNPDLIFRLAELSPWPYIRLCPKIIFEEMCHPDLTFWPALLFGSSAYYFTEVCSQVPNRQ